MDTKLTKEQREALKILTSAKIGDFCPQCHIGTIILKQGKYGKFLACDGFPQCSFTQNIKKDNQE